MPRGYWIILGLAGCALLIGPVQFRLGNWRRPPAVVPGVAVMRQGSFKPGGVFPSTATDLLPANSDTRGSWLGSDDFQGSHETGWWRAEPNITIMVAGYPALAPNRLEVEVRNDSGPVQTIVYEGGNPGERWTPWPLALPDTAKSFRIQAFDNSSTARGWLAFSEPWYIKSPLSWQAWALLQLTASTCLALALLYGPGLLCLSRESRPTMSALSLVSGPFVLLALGLICWALGGSVAPAITARVGVALFLTGLAIWMWRVRRQVPLSREMSTVMVGSALLVGFAVAKANVSFGPPGELYHDTVSRTLEVGGHSDSRISFHVVQVVAHHLAPFSPEAQAYFSPWNFGSRGPLAGIIAAPLVLATGAHVPRDMPDQPWSPFDREGFAVYRITLIVLASLAAWAVFGLTATLCGAAWGLFAAAVALLAPFFVHELYFTWPKLFAAALVLSAFQVTLAGRPVVAGIALAAGYLFHPLALLSAPIFVLWLLRGGRGKRLASRCVAIAGFLGGMLVLMLPWQLICLHQFGTGNSQAMFFDYFRHADGQQATWASWWRSRWENFANTFVPFHLLAFDRAHESINSIEGPSPRWVQAGFLYWNTLPFALGLPAFTLMAMSLGQAVRRDCSKALLLVIGPALFLVAYWGAADSGMMRHCGHVVFLSVIVFGVWSFQRSAGSWAETTLAAFLHPACFAWRAAEIALMAFGPSALGGWRHGPWDWNNVISLAAALLFLSTATFLIAGATRAKILPQARSKLQPVPAI